MNVMESSSLSQLAFIWQISASSALDSPIRKQLQRHADLFFWFLLISTAFVAVGIFFEWPEVRNEFREWWRLRRSQTAWLVNPPHRSRLPVWALIGFLLVSGGVAAEGIFEGLLGIEDTKIRKFDESAIADSIKHAGNAETSARCAADAAANAQSRADSAHRAASDAIAEARIERAARTKLEKQLDTETKQRLILAANLRGRVLLDQSGMVNELASVPPHRVIFVYVDSEEARNLAEQIAYVFYALKWPFVGRPQNPERSQILDGVAVSCGDQSPRPALLGNSRLRQEIDKRLASMIRRILAGDGISLSDLPASIEGASTEPSSTILIGVGPSTVTARW